jgi:hypothetical protein
MVSPVSGKPVVLGELARGEVGRDRTGTLSSGMRSGTARIALSATYGITE